MSVVLLWTSDRFTTTPGRSANLFPVPNSTRTTTDGSFDPLARFAWCGNRSCPFIISESHGAESSSGA